MKSIELKTLLQWIEQKAPEKGPALVGIDGPGGSGKSTIATLLAGSSPRASVVLGDDFYRPEREQPTGPIAERPVGANFDLARLKEQVLEPVKTNRSTKYQKLDWGTGDLGEFSPLDVPNLELVVVEGVYSTSGENRALFDFLIWVDCPRELRLNRGLERDGEEARKQWTEDWMPQEDRYIELESPANHAHVVASGKGSSPPTLEGGIELIRYLGEQYE